MELSFEELVANFESLAADCPFNPGEEAYLKEEQSKYELSCNALSDVAEAAKYGASRELAMTLESIAPGVLPERYPVNSFTVIPSGTNLKVTYEAIGGGKLAAAAAIIAAIFAALYKLAKWVIALLRGSKGVNETAMKETAQARTAAETVNEAVKQTNGPLPAQGFDPKEISKIREQVFLTPARQQISKALFMLVFEQRPLYHKLYSALCAQLVAGRNDLFSSVEMAISGFSGRLNDFVKRSANDDTTTEESLVGLFDQPLLPVVYALQDAGLLVVETDFQGRRLSSVGKFLQGVNQEQYLRSISLAHELLTGNALVKIDADDECAALAQSSVFFSPDYYSSNVALDALENNVKWFGGNVMIPADTDVRLSRVEEALTDLRKTMAAFEQAAKRDTNAQLLAPRLVVHLNSFQQDIQFLTRFVYTIRVLQRELAMFGRLMTTGETACLNYLKSLLDKGAEGKLADLIAKKRKEHQAVLSRFKGYLE